MFRSVLLFIAIATVAVADPQTKSVSISHGDAADLFGALTSLQPGLTQEHAFIAADDILLLRPIKEKTDVASNSARWAAMRLPGSQDPSVTAERNIGQAKIEENLQSFLLTKEPLDLETFELSYEESKDAKLTPAQISRIRQFLSPPKPPTPPK